MFTIDHSRMRAMAFAPPRPGTATDLFREGRAFFVGGALPIQDTLETMFESQCTASTDVFVVTFGGEDTMRQCLDMVRHLKKNFNMRLMVRLGAPVPDSLYPQAYASGADLVDIDLSAFHTGDGAQLEPRHGESAIISFPSWSVASTVTINDGPAKQQTAMIDKLLRFGIVPLPRLAWDGSAESEKEVCAVLQYLARAWGHHRVAIKPFTPVICFSSPLVPSHRPGAVRAFLDRLHERRQLVAGDMLRHLRVTTPADSLDSAAL